MILATPQLVSATAGLHRPLPTEQRVGQIIGCGAAGGAASADLLNAPSVTPRTVVRLRRLRDADRPTSEASGWRAV